TTVGSTPNGPSMTPPGIRYEDYTFLLNGAAGDLYGHRDVFTNTDSSNWQNLMNSPGAQQMTFFVNFEQSLPWYNLVPDQSGTVFSGIGTPSQYSGAYTPDGTLAIAYKATTGTTSQSFTVNMGHFAGTVTAKWFDPTNGTYTTIGSNLANSGTMTF